MPKNAGGILNLVNDDGRRMPLEETLWLLFGLLGFGGKIEGDESLAREEVQAGGGFANLSSACQGDHWPRLRRAFQAALNIA
jgi:hypothetical protein